MPKIKVGIMYDFDKTLCTTDMQNYTFMSDIGMKPEEFWGECGVVTKKHEMDKILTYMYVTIKKAKEKGIKLTKEYLNSLGKSVVLYRGVSTWFERINEFAESKGVEVEHYVISSGVKEIIEGTSIAKYFKKIYACKFIYDEETKEAIWPAMAINFTQKTQYIFRISKGALDETEEEKLNSDTKDHARAIQYRNMIYIGDGLTDIPCMQLLKDKGGKSIALYQNASKEKILPLIEDKRINSVCLADYSVNSALEKTVKLMIENIATLESLRVREEKQLNSFSKLITEKKVKE
jgi:2-hydroxy-3-keto-5-methylthiopentenyl-1-phosphate phosphatase